MCPRRRKKQKQKAPGGGWEALSFHFSSPINWLYSISESRFPYLEDVLANNYDTALLGWEVSKANKAATKAFKVQALSVLRLSLVHFMIKWREETY